MVWTSVKHWALPRVPLICSYHILTSSVMYNWTDARQNRIYLLNRNTSGSLGEREMLLEHEPIGECFQSFFESMSWQVTVITTAYLRLHRYYIIETQFLTNQRTYFLWAIFWCILIQFLLGTDLETFAKKPKRYLVGIYCIFVVLLRKSLKTFPRGMVEIKQTLCHCRVLV